MSNSTANTDARLWDARHFVYTFWVERGQAPGVQDTAQGLGIPVTEAGALYQELNARHAILLMPGTQVIRMANPFSAVPTGFRVHVGERSFYANCAWDAFGIPAALHADASIETFCAQTQEPLRLRVENGSVYGDPAVAYFRLPFAQWYDDLVFT